MLNLKKISKVLLTAGALVFASFCVLEANAQIVNSGRSPADDMDNLREQQRQDSDKAKINAAQQDKSRKERKADQAASSASSQSTAQYKNSAAAMANQEAAAQTARNEKDAAQRQSDAYKSSEAYKNAQQNYQKQEQKRQDNVAQARQEHQEYVQSVTEKHDAKINAAQQRYDECMKRNGSCSSYLVELNQIKNARTDVINAAKNDKKYQDKIAEAELGDSAYRQAVNEKLLTDVTASDYDSQVSAAAQEEKAAETARQKAKQEGVTAANRAIQANQDKIAVAEKEKAKAEKKLNDAREDVEKKCGKNPNSNACKKAMEKMDAASIEVGAANQTIAEANSAINQANAEKALLNMDDEMAAFEAEMEADFNKTLEEQDAAAQQKRAEEEAKSREQKEKQKAADDAAAANKAYDKAVADYKEAAESLAYWQKECQKNTKNESACANAAAAEEYLAETKAAADEAYKDKQEKEKIAEEKGAVEEAVDLSQQLKTAQENRAAAEENLAKQQQALKEAQAACEHSKTLTSKQGKADAEKYCAMAEQLEQQVADAEHELMLATAAEQMAEDSLAIEREMKNEFGDEHFGQEYKAFSTAKEETQMFDGSYAGNIDYSNTGDVFSTITRRAARILVGLKPIVYTFAGFGLIGFAFMAIFNKISWKWFANIAIGLFLVANMGRLIEYMVYTKDNRELTENDKLDAFGDYLHKGFADTEYAWVDEMTPYVPPEIIAEETPDTSVQPPEEKEDETRKFCGKTDGASGWGNFTSCVKDLISAGKKAVDTAKKVQNTVDTVKNTVDNVKFAADNIGAAIDKIGEGNLEDSFNALSQIGKNVNYIVGSTGGALNNVMSNTIDIANNVQDISKSTDEQAELQARRDRGEATGGFTAALMGQTVTRDENGKVTGVERRWGGELEYDDDGNVVVKQSGFATETFEGTTKDGKNAVGTREVQVQGDIASNKKNGQNTGQLGFMDITQDVVKKSGEINQKFDEASQTAGALTGAVANFSIGGSKTINEGRQERQAERRAAEAEKEAAKADAKRAEQQQVKKGEGLLSDMLSGAGQTDSTQEATQAYQQAQQTAQEAESSANAAEQKAMHLEAEAQDAEAEADRLMSEAKKAAEKAKESGSAQDLQAAKDLEARAKRAQAEADAAKVAASNVRTTAEEARAKAEEAKAPLEELYQKSLDEKLNNAKAEQEAAAAEAEKIHAEAETANEALENKKAAFDKSAQDLENARQEALEAQAALQQDPNNSAKQKAYQEAMKALGQADDANKAAERDYNQTKTTAEDGERKAREAEQRAADAKAEQTRLEVERDSGWTEEKEEQAKRQDEKDRKTSQQQEATANQVKTALEQALNPVTAAERANKEYTEAQFAAEQAKAQADKKAKEAARKQAEAEEARRNAKTPSEKAKADALQKNADRAKAEADAAATAAAEAEKPLEELNRAATEASIEESKYIQETAKAEQAEAERNIPTYRNEVSAAEEEYKRAQNELQRLVEAYQKGDNSKDLLLAINEANETWQAKERAYKEAQKKLEDEIRRGNDAEVRQREAYARQLELEGK